MFENTLNLIGDADLSFLHIFPFSARRGTPAARMPPVQPATIRSRAAQLRSRGAVQLQHRLKRLVGTEQMLLVEGPGHGRSECFARARFGAPAGPGSCVRARVVDARADHLKAELLG
jgi:threonylcarbamoyladenosine tRNA methylthiotransferase MtaB